MWPFKRRRLPAPRRLVVGLGNPGRRYADTRHNVGFRVIEELARRHGIRRTRNLDRVQVACGDILGVPTALCRPQTFMNNSGEAVAPLLRRFGLAASDLLVVQDDLDLETGRLRVRAQGSAGGHRGMRSLMEGLGSGEFARVRIGIGRPRHGEPIDHVLSPFSADEEPLIRAAVEQAAEAVECWLTEGVEAAMNRFNRRPPPANSEA